MRYQPIENYGVIGNMRTRRAGRAGRVDRLAVPAALRLAERLRGDPRRRQGRPVPHRPGRGRRAAAQAVLLAGHQRPGHPLPAPRRHRRGRGLHAGRAAADARTTSSSAGSGSSAAGCRSGWSAGRRSTTPGRATRPRSSEHGARFDGPGLRLGLAASVPLERDGDGAVGEFTLGEGESATFVLRAIAPRRPRRPLPRHRRGRGPVPRDGRLLAAVGGPLHLPGPVARGGPALGPGAEAAHLRADRGDRRRPDDQPARGHRRGPELGLPLHLDPRRRVHPVRLPADRVHRGGGPVHGLADRPVAGARLALRRPAAAHVRDRRPVRPGRGGAAAPGRLRGVEAGADRQRRPRPAPARHLRRADGRGLPAQQVRRPGRLRRLDAPARTGRLGGRQLAAAGRGRLGGARRAAALRLLAVHVLGGAGPRPAAGGQALASRPTGPVAGGPRRGLRGGDGARAGTRSEGRSCRPTAPTPWTPPPCSCR